MDRWRKHLVELGRKRRLNLTDRRFGRLVAISISNKKKRGQLSWRCECDCGATIFVVTNKLTSGHTQSCGCLRRDELAKSVRTHGLSQKGSAEYRAWKNMRNRCNNPNSKTYEYYGGRGVKVCERWNDFTAFVDDMGARPSPKHSLGRIDNAGDYEPGNVRWETGRQQATNRRPKKRYSKTRLSKAQPSNWLLSSGT